MNTYLSIAKPSEYQFKEKGSKFIAYAFPIKDSAEAKTCLDQVRKDHPKANHHCYAYLLKEGKEDYYIANDDGEPSNSAGMPILGQIKSFELHQVLIVVVRYFGGTKLGVGGLISAYKEGAKGCLEAATILKKEVLLQLKLNCNFNQLGQVLSIIDKHQLEAQIDHTSTGSSITLTMNSEMETKVKALFAGIDISFH